MDGTGHVIFTFNQHEIQVGQRSSRILSAFFVPQTEIVDDALRRDVNGFHAERDADSATRPKFPLFWRQVWTSSRVRDPWRHVPWLEQASKLQSAEVVDRSIRRST